VGHNWGDLNGFAGGSLFGGVDISRTLTVSQEIFLAAVVTDKAGHRYNYIRDGNNKGAYKARETSDEEMDNAIDNWMNDKQSYQSDGTVNDIVFSNGSTFYTHGPNWHNTMMRQAFLVLGKELHYLRG
jgi:hypothetical protein